MVEVRYLRKVIRISAHDSPNVRARARVLPGVLSWEEFQHRMLTWDERRRTVGLEGQFYEGAEVLMYPATWLTHSEQLADRRGTARSKDGGPWMGCDPAEGGDRSSWCVGDRDGLLDLVSVLTPDTNEVPLMTLRLMNQWGVLDHNVCFDRGGGGKQHADRLRASGHMVRTVAFGESVIPPLNRRGGIKVLEERVEEREERTIYKNRRAEMYGALMELMDPARGGYALPSRLINMLLPGRLTLREQLALMPKLYDAEGRLFMLPKNKPRTDLSEDGAITGQDTLSGLIGHSPDEADALVVMVHCMTTKASSRAVVGVS